LCVERVLEQHYHDRANGGKPRTANARSLGFASLYSMVYFVIYASDNLCAAFCPAT
jgi:hypothetical protein